MVTFLDTSYHDGRFDQVIFAIYEVVKKGDKSMAWWLFDCYQSRLRIFLLSAVIYGQEDIFDCFYSESNDITTQELLTAAFKGGSMKIIHFLIGKGGVVNHGCLENATTNGRLEALSFGCEWVTPDVPELFYIACLNNHLKLAKYLYGKGVTPSPIEVQEEMFETSRWIKPESFDVLEWLLTLERDSKTFMENIITREDPWLANSLGGKTLTNRIINNGFDYHRLSGTHKYAIAPLVVPLRIKRIRMRKFGWYWHSKWLIKSGNPNNPRGVFLRQWIATIPTDFVHE
jgi:hypothetical protein